MPTSLTSAVPAFKAALVSALDAALTPVQVTYWWPGPDTEAEGVYLGETESTGGTASIKAGRQHRNEVITQEVILQTWEAAPTPDATAAEARAFELLAALENVMAATPAVTGTVQFGELSAHRSQLLPFGNGIACRITAVVTATARLV